MGQWRGTLVFLCCPDGKVHEAYMGPTWGQQDPDGPHIGPMNLVIRVGSHKHPNLFHYVTMILCTFKATLITCMQVYTITGGNRTKLPSSRWRRRGRSLREVFACSCFFATIDLSQIYNGEARRHGTPCTKTTDPYLFSFLYNDPRKIRRETTVGKFVPNNGRR